MLLETIVKLIFTDVTETNKKKVTSGLFVGYRTVLLIGVVAIVYIQQSNMETLDAIQNDLAKLRHSQIGAETRYGANEKFHSDIQVQIDKLRAELEDNKKYGFPISDRRISLLEKKVFGNDKSSRF